ncbi:MAG: YihA family ribosome biogenesis GTP-binding protein [Deltaproteobacteria bacterium]|nr:YihA family ribosome biogenesis GTP-binding protein [Deltaproteobacteria bacterium]
MTVPQIQSAEFLLSVHRTEQLPRGDLPEVAFLGRSNVGKSSLINTLLGRKKLVRTSSTPGCTRGLNFFLINGRWHFVDLPGYGYARAPAEVKAGWGRLIMDYLETREGLAAVVFLQDGRRDPGPEELFLWERLKSRGRAVIPVLTKADKLKKGERSRRLQDVAAALRPHGPEAQEFLWFSAATREGRAKLWARLVECLGGA